jgi:hypothetical protein
LAERTPAVTVCVESARRPWLNPRRLTAWQGSSTSAAIYPDSAHGFLFQHHGWFAADVDQPSTQFSSLGIAAVTEVGFELDQKLAKLLEILNLEVPSALACDLS